MADKPWLKTTKKLADKGDEAYKRAKELISFAEDADIDLPKESAKLEQKKAELEKIKGAIEEREGE